VRQQNILIHCSDGWDRTAQLSSLAQLLLDPYYRTFEGFQVLVEKDWISFGHMFARRCGHYSVSDTSNRAQIFLQFIDCVQTLWHQMSHQFEFNDAMLTFLADELHSCKYGNFFYNSECERLQMKVAEKTISVWTVVHLHKDTLFKNGCYQGLQRAQRITSISYCESWTLRFWREYFCQFSEPVEPGDNGFVADAEKQLDMAIEEEIDQQVLLQSLLTRSAKQIDLLHEQSSGLMNSQQMVRPNKAELFVSQIFQNVNEEYVVTSEKAIQGVNKDPLDLDDDSYEELSHSLPISNRLGSSQDGVLDRLDELLDECVETSRDTLILNNTSCGTDSARDSYQ